MTPQPAVTLSPAKEIKKKDKVKEAKNKPRKPSAYIGFCKKKRPEIVAADPTLTFGEVGKALGAAWGKLSDDEKQKFAA